MEAEKMKTAEERIKELTAMGEFKTFGEAREYCKLHGLDESHYGNNAFQIAGALMDARKDQEKIIRYACADSVSELEYITVVDEDGINDFALSNSGVMNAIMNTKAI
jgi:hypothetical protein